MSILMCPLHFRDLSKENPCSGGASLAWASRSARRSARLASTAEPPPGRSLRMLTRRGEAEVREVRVRVDGRAAEQADAGADPVAFRRLVGVADGLPWAVGRGETERAAAAVGDVDGEANVRRDGGYGCNDAIIDDPQQTLRRSRRFQRDGGVR